MSVLILDDTTFQSTLGSDTPVIVDFYADWCGPCKALAPILEEVATEFKGRLVLGKVNVDDHPDLAAPYHVRSIPTLIAFKGGQKIDVHVGGMTKSQLVEWIQSILA